MHDYQIWFSRNYPNLRFNSLAPFAQKRIQLRFQEDSKRKAYYQRPEIKAKRKAYYQRPEIKAKQKAYRQEHSEELKAKRKAYYQRPKIKAKRKRLAEARIKFLKLPLWKRREIILANHRRPV